MTSQKLDFAQQFGDLPIFMVVSALTTTTTATNNKVVNSHNITQDEWKEIKNEGGTKKALITISKVIEYSKLVIRTFQSDAVEAFGGEREDGLEHIPPVIQLKKLEHQIV